MRRTILTINPENNLLLNLLPANVKKIARHVLIHEPVYKFLTFLKDSNKYFCLKGQIYQSLSGHFLAPERKTYGNFVALGLKSVTV